MMLSELLSGFSEVAEDVAVSGLTLNSQNVKPGDVFFALSGSLQHGLQYAQQALCNGAVAVVYEPVKGCSGRVDKLVGCCKVAVTELSKKLGFIASRFYDFPTRKLVVVGITGTNGKTTCSQYLAQLLPHCGIIGTLGWGEFGALTTLVNTTPDALAIQGLMQNFVEQGKQTVAIEVSSHGLTQGRVNGVNFQGAVFTNISHDHLDYHGSMEAYLRAKLRLFTSPKLQFTVINLDDDYATRIIAAIPETVKKWGYSLHGNQLTGGQTINASEVVHDQNGMRCVVSWKQEKSLLKAPVFVDFNLQNILAVQTTLLAMGCTFADSMAQLHTLKPIAGRMEKVSRGKQQLQVIVDYAHTPDALEKLLLGLRQHCQRKLWLVFGCGGDRDAGKRAVMGKIAGQYADHVVITNDNPRFENAENIINQILSACDATAMQVISNRKQAIKYAINQAAQEDMVVIAGKGHEQYQDIAGRREPFSDRQVAEQALQDRYGE